MPLYDYKCERCGQTFEVRQKFADEPLTVHEGCGGAVHRLLSAPALQFKGSGWYITDYAKSGSGGNGSKSSESKPAAEAGKSTETKAPASSPSGGESKAS